MGRTLRKMGASAFIALGMAGCADESGVIGPPPGGGPFSPQATAASIYSLRFAPDNVAVAHVRFISYSLGLTSSASRTPRTETRGITPRASLAPAFVPEGIKRAVADRTLRLSRGQSAVPLFPINFLGETFVYDAGLDAYVLDGSRGGAPQNGIRFIMYTLDPDLRLPALPLHPIGFVDLIDQSDAVSTRLRVRAFDDTSGGNVALADYVVDGAFGSLSTGIIVNLLAEGFIADRNGRFDFALDELLETDDTADLTLVSLVHEVVSAEGTRVELGVEGDLANDGSFSDLVFRFDILGGAGVTRVDLDIVNDQQDGTIRHGGAVEAVVGGTVSEPTFFRPGGGGFTVPQLLALDEILFGIDDVLILADELYWPLGELFGVR